MFEKCSSCSETRAYTLTQSLTSRDWAMIERTVHRKGENESLSIAAIDNGHMSGYGIGLLYRRIRGRLSCQSAYRAPLINRRKRDPLSFLTWHGVCGNQPSAAYGNFASAFVLLSSLSTFLLSLILPFLFSLFLSLFVPLFLVSPSFLINLFVRENVQLAKRGCSIDRTLLNCLKHWPYIQATRFCSNQKLSISVHCFNSEIDLSEIAVK